MRIQQSTKSHFVGGTKDGMELPVPLVNNELPLGVIIIEEIAVGEGSSRRTEVVGRQKYKLVSKNPSPKYQFEPD